MDDVKDGSEYWEAEVAGFEDIEFSDVVSDEDGDEDEGGEVADKADGEHNQRIPSKYHGHDLWHNPKNHTSTISDFQPLFQIQCSIFDTPRWKTTTT